MLGEALALTCAVTWALSVILFKRSEQVSPQALNLFKNVVGIILLVLTMPIMGLSIDWSRPSADWWALIASGAIGIGIADTAFFMALRRLGAGLVAVVECVYAPTIVILAVIFLGEELGWSFAAGAALVIGGVLLAVLEEIKVPKKGIAAGVALSMFGVFCMAIGVVLAKGPLERGALVEVTLIRLVAGIATQLVWIVPFERSALAVLKPSPVWRTLMPAAVLGAYISMLFWLGGFKYADASVAAVLNQLSTVFTMLFAWALLKEKPSGRRLLGGLIAVAGAVVVLLG